MVIAPIMWRTAQGMGLLIGIASCVLVVRADAQEYCVACSEPNAVYRCIIDGAQPGGMQSLQMFCITAMANDGGHATCSVKLGSVFECIGPIKRISWAARNQPERHGSWDVIVQPAPQLETKAPAADTPPKTMVDFAKQANEKAVQQFKKAGDDVTGTAKTFGQTIANATNKTWQCLASFFTRCGE